MKTTAFMILMMMALEGMQCIDDFETVASINGGKQSHGSWEADASPFLHPIQQETNTVPSMGRPSLDSSSEAHAKELIHVYNLIQILKPQLRDRSFKDAYELSRLWKSDDASPLDRQELNPLALHDANLDNQYAFKQWMKMPMDLKKSAVLSKLLENPTVSFSNIDEYILGKALAEVILLGDVDNFKAVYNKLEISPNDQQAVDLALAYTTAKNGQLEILKYLLIQKKVDLSNPQNSLAIQYYSALSGSKPLMEYILEVYRLPDGTKMLIYPQIQLDAALVGSKELVEYILDGYTLPDGSKVPIDPRIQLNAAASGSKKLMEYLLEEYTFPDGSKFKVDPRIQLNAASSKNKNLVKYILEDYTFPDGTKLTVDPMIQFNAASSGSKDLMQYLLEEYTFSNGTKLQVDPRIQLNAASSGNKDLLQYLLEGYKLPGGGTLALHPHIQKYAAAAGQLDVLTYLIDLKGEPIKYRLIIDGARSATNPYSNYMLDLLKYLHEDKKLPIPWRISKFSSSEKQYLKLLKNKGPKS